MDIKKRRSEIRKKYFSTGGMILVTLLIIICILLLIILGTFDVRSYQELRSLISNEGIGVLLSIFLAIAGVRAWIEFIINIILPPKEEILFLEKTNKIESKFLNKKGRKIIFEKCDLAEKKFYYVLKTHNYIYKVLEECVDQKLHWKPKEKKSYWMNLYSPMGNFEDVFLLPIVYFILVVTTLSIVLSNGFDKLYGIFLSIYPLYILIYDLKKKLIINKETKDDSFSLAKLYYLTPDKIQKLIHAIATFLMFLYVLVFSKRFLLYFSPFLLALICYTGKSLAYVFENNKVRRIFEKGYCIAVLLFFLELLMPFTIAAIKSEVSSLVIIFTGFFWYIFVRLAIKWLFKN